MGENRDPEILEAARRQDEKMADLGKRTAGLAHELNNPLAAANRAASLLRENVLALSDLTWRIAGLGLTADQGRSLHELQCQVFERNPSAAPEDVLVRSDQEEDLGQWLEAHDVPEAWKLAAGLARGGFDRPLLDRVQQITGEKALSDVLAWLEKLADLNGLLIEIEQSSQRMAHLVKAIRAYTYRNQEPAEVDLHENLENTLLMLGYKFKGGVKLVREYAAKLPKIRAYAGELSQVWMNLIDNALDALGDSGTIWIRTAQEGETVIVEIADDGPGIPADIQGHIFEPFFTTKAAGKGTGMGLEISYRIVTGRHQGELTVESRPGDTRFRVRLPVGGPGGEGG